MAYDHYSKHDFKDKNIKPLLDLLLKTFALNILVKDKELLFESGFFTRGSTRLVADSFAKLLQDLRPHMVPLSETFEIYDGKINSVIGNKYGDIYEKMLDTARASKLNKNKVPKFYDTLIKPVMNMRREHKL